MNSNDDWSEQILKTVSLISIEYLKKIFGGKNLQNIKNDGYATGSQYVDHTMALINLYNLTQFDN